MFLIFRDFQFAHHIPVPTVCIFHFSRFSVFLAIFQVIQWLCLILHVFHCFSPNPGPTVFLIFHVFHSFSPYSMSYNVCFSICTIFSFSHHISCTTMWVSHFPHLSDFSPYSRSYSVHFNFFVFFSVFPQIPDHILCVSFSSFVSFLGIFPVLECVFLILHDVQCFLPYFVS